MTYILNKQHLIFNKYLLKTDYQVTDVMPAAKIMSFFLRNLPNPSGQNRESTGGFLCGGGTYTGTLGEDERDQSN